jgi:ABC-type transporter Mla MlaB component
MNIIESNESKNTNQLMPLEHGKADGVLELSIETPEYINMNFYEEFRDAYFDNKEPYKKYVIDFKNTKKMQSCVFGMLLQLHEYIKSDATIHLVNCNSDIKNLFSLTSFGENFKIQ